jgi:hypothetical protein
VVLLLAACDRGFLPLQGRFEIGRDPMVVFVGGDAPGGGDLYVLEPAGGPATRITFSVVGEMRPALSPDGGQVAFLRAGTLTDSTPASVWVLNLANGAERRIRLPRGADPPKDVAWSDDGRSLVVRSARGVYGAPAPPQQAEARPLAGPERVAAESALAVLLGRPAFARVVPCAEERDLCVVADTGPPALLARDAREPVRWGSDSVAYLSGTQLLVRPVGAGRARRVAWSDVPPRPRQFTVFPGSTERR